MTFNSSAGERVGGRFVLAEQISSGGFATVWRATDVDSGNTVAVKCANDAVHDREEVRARFRRELRWFCRFEGEMTPGALVQFIDGEVDDDRAYVVTELVEGDPLDSYFDTDRSPGIEAFESVGAPVCGVVDFFHRNDVCYLDLKPTNVLVRRCGLPALVDFNAAVADAEEPETLFHHAAFKPPELTPTELRDEPVGSWSDVYSLGALVAYLLTGRATAFGDAALDEWHAIDPRQLGSSCPKSLAAAIRKATEPRPAERFADAGAFFDAISSHFDGSDRSAVLTHAQSGSSLRVRPGTTLGRWTPERPVPTVVVDDDDGFVAPEQAVFVHERGDWFLRDRSPNGTFVRTDAGVEYLLSSRGVERRRAEGRRLPRPDPADSVRLTDGDRIMPVDVEYGIEMLFRTE